MNKISTCLWFDNNADEAANFYVSVFKNSKITNISKYVEGSHGKIGDVMTVNFELDGRKFMALNGGPIYKINEAVSFIINCKDQNEIDYYWEKLTDGGEEVQCGWLKDKFGVSWQVIPENMGELMSSNEPEKPKRAMEAMLKMKKIEIEKLKNA